VLPDKKSQQAFRTDERALANPRASRLPRAKNGLQDQAGSNIRQVLEDPQFNSIRRGDRRPLRDELPRRGVLTISPSP
jgi:hypothetical protein